jgi:PmbA protein
MTEANNSLQDYAVQLLDKARAKGADAVDVVAARGTSVDIEVRHGTLEQAERAEGIDLGLRVFIGKRSAIVSGSDISDATLDMMAERAVAMAKLAPEDPYCGLADPEQLAHDTSTEHLELWDPSPEPDAKMLEQRAFEAEAAALAVEGVTQSQSAGASYGANEICVVATNGLEAHYCRTSSSISCVAIAGSGLGMERDYDGDQRIFASDLRDAASIGTRAGERAVRRLEPKRPNTGTYPILFDERISSTLLGHFLSAINGSSIARGSSWLLDALGTQVFPSTMTITEDPHRPRVSGSRVFDGEGLATTQRDLVRDGILQGWTLDLSTGRKLGMESTANAGRGVSSPPSPMAWNVEMTQGDASFDDLVADMGTGLIVTSLIGSTINPNTGDYSRGASGLWVQNGEITHAVSEVTIAGNLKEMLASIIPANDARRHLSRVVPSLLVEGMTLAGS